MTPEKIFSVYVNATSPCIKQQRFPDKCKCPYWQYTWEVTIVITTIIKKDVKLEYL